MKIYIFSHDSILKQDLEKMTNHTFEIIDIESEEDMILCDIERCILIVDIDSVKDTGFSIASKMANRPDKTSLIIGVTTLDVDSTDSKFDFFFHSIEEFKMSFEEIIDHFKDDWFCHLGLYFFRMLFVIYYNHDEEELWPFYHRDTLGQITSIEEKGTTIFPNGNPGEKGKIMFKLSQ